MPPNAPLDRDDEEGDGDDERLLALGDGELERLLALGDGDAPRLLALGDGEDERLLALGDGEDERLLALGAASRPRYASREAELPVAPRSYFVAVALSRYDVPRRWSGLCCQFPPPLMLTLLRLPVLILTTLTLPPCQFALLCQ